MRKDRALAKELQAILDGLHDSTVSADPFECDNDEAELARREADLAAVRGKLSNYVHVSRARTIAKLFGLGTVAPLAILAVLVTLDVPSDTGARAWTWTLLLVTAAVFSAVSVAVWWPSSIDEDIGFALYAVSRRWSFSARHGRAVWKQLRGRYSFFRRGDEDQRITARIWGRTDADGSPVGGDADATGATRAFMMFDFHWVDVERRVTYDPVKKRTETKEVRIPRDRHGMFARMPESRIRMRITETGGADGLEESIRLEYGALNKAVDVHCRKADELEARKFLSPAVQEILMEFSRFLPGMVLDLYPGHVLLASELDFLAGAKEIKLNRDGAGFEGRLQPWIDAVEEFRSSVDEGLRRIAKYND